MPLRTKRSLLALFFSLLFMLITGCDQAGASSITVFAAGGAKPALDEICRQFEEQNQTKVEVTYGGGGEMLSKMLMAKCGDVYIAPEQRFMEAAREKKAIAPNTIKSIAYMVPVIAVPKGNPGQIFSVAALVRTGVRVAITREETTLLGKYAPEIFYKAGIAEAVGKNIVTQASDPNNLLNMLFMKQVDAAIIWHFYPILASDKIEAILLPCDVVPGMGEMQAAVTTYSQNSKAAQEFIDFMSGSQGKEIFQEQGYITDIKEVKTYCK
jgi:molybdate transport system substrate-binding protein